MKKIKLYNHILYNREYYITSDYKLRNKSRPSHNGIDFIGKNKSTDYVVSIDNGKVITSTYSKSAGYYIEILHSNGYISRYLHLKKGSLNVRKGQNVYKGDILGYMGSTGKSTGAHLHFSILDSKKNVLDPLPFLLSSDPSYTLFISKVKNILNTKSIKDSFSKTITISKSINRKHKLVKVIQEYLYNMGYTIVGKIDGIAGSKFTKAVKEFQLDNKCVVDGIITKKNKTWRCLLKY